MADIMKLLSKNNIKEFIIGSIGIGIIYGIYALYYVVANIHFTPIRNLFTPIDYLIPLIPEFLLIYLFVFYTFIFFTIFITQYYLKSYRIPFIIIFAIVALTSYGIYMIFPVAMIRPTVASTDFWTSLLNLLYASDPSVNCFPSLHAAYSTMAAYIIWHINKKWGKYIAWPVAFGVILSTLFVRQHVIVDEIAGFLLGFIVPYIVLKKFNLEPEKENINIKYVLIILIAATLVMLLMAFHII